MCQAAPQVRWQLSTSRKNLRQKRRNKKRTWLLPLLPSNVQILEIKILYDHFCHYLSILHRPQTTLCERTSNWCFKSLSMLSMAVMRFSSIPSRAGFPNSAFVKWTQHSVRSENWARSRSDAWRKQFAGSLSVWVHGVPSCLRRLRPSPSSNPLHRFSLSGQNTWSLESRKKLALRKTTAGVRSLGFEPGHAAHLPHSPPPFAVVFRSMPHSIKQVSWRGGTKHTVT